MTLGQHGNGTRLDVHVVRVHQLSLYPSRLACTYEIYYKRKKEKKKKIFFLMKMEERR